MLGAPRPREVLGPPRGEVAGGGEPAEGGVEAVEVPQGAVDAVGGRARGRRGDEIEQLLAAEGLSLVEPAALGDDPRQPVQRHPPGVALGLGRVEEPSGGGLGLLQPAGVAEGEGEPCQRDDAEQRRARIGAGVEPVERLDAEPGRLLGPAPAPEEVGQAEPRLDGVSSRGLADAVDDRERSAAVRLGLVELVQPDPDRGEPAEGDAHGRVVATEGGLLDRQPARE